MHAYAAKLGKKEQFHILNPVNKSYSWRVLQCFRSFQKNGNQCRILIYNVFTLTLLVILNLGSMELCLSFLQHASQQYSLTNTKHMKKFLLASGTALAGTMAAVAQTSEKPNIILFLVDDMGWQETSVPFYKDTTALNHRYHTPNMERMAKMGVKFTQAYASAISSPSRCSLMTGMNPARHRVTNWTLQYDNTNDASGGLLKMPDWNYNGLQPDTVTSARDLKNTALATALPQLLKDNGYYTIHCGKAHWGAIGTAGENPKSFGFDVNIAGGANGAPGSYLAQDNYGSGLFHVQGLEKYYNEGTFLTEALTLEAM